MGKLSDDHRSTWQAFPSGLLGFLLLAPLALSLILEKGNFIIAFFSLFLLSNMFYAHPWALLPLKRESGTASRWFIGLFILEILFWEQAWLLGSYPRVYDASSENLDLILLLPVTVSKLSLFILILYIIVLKSYKFIKYIIIS